VKNFGVIRFSKAMNTITHCQVHLVPVYGDKPDQKCGLVMDAFYSSNRGIFLLLSPHEHAGTGVQRRKKSGIFPRVLVGKGDM
jgi:hypothetical protein